MTAVLKPTSGPSSAEWSSTQSSAEWSSAAWPPPLRLPIGWIGEPRLLRGITEQDLTPHAAHLAVHGPLAALDRQRLLGLLDAASLTGRGGAGFPLAAKIRSLRRGRPVVVVNGAEGEPASAKDHVLLERTPHLVLDGAALLAGAIGARRVLLAIADPRLAAGLRRAITSRPDQALFELRGVTDRFVSGEATALVAALNGGPGVPPGRRTLATHRGVGGAPTLLANAETFAQLAVLGRTGVAGYASVGTATEPGTTLLSVSGAVRNPGVVEVPLGTEFGRLAAVVGAQPSQAVVIGGYHGSWLATVAGDTPLSKAGLAPLGARLGAGVLIFVGERTCPLAELARTAQWLADQSVKQCGPCAFGLPALAADVRALLTRSPGAGRPDDGNRALRHAGQLTGRGACAHPDGAVRFVCSGLAVLTDELRTHQADGGCRRPDLGMLALSRAGAFGGR